MMRQYFRYQTKPALAWKDFQTCLKIIFNAILSLGSFHTASKHPLTVWGETAKKYFNLIKNDDFVKRRGVYDKMIIDCAFREDLRRRRSPDPNGGCEGFQPSLTTNGMCHTFNGKKTSELWKP